MSNQFEQKMLPEGEIPGAIRREAIKALNVMMEKEDVQAFVLVSVDKAGLVAMSGGGSPAVMLTILETAHRELIKQIGPAAAFSILADLARLGSEME